MEPCKKTKYPSEKEANRDIEIIRNKSNREVVPVRSYRCNICNFWHLTSKEDLKEKINLLQKQIEDLKKENDKLKSDFEEVASGVHKQITLELRKDAKIKELQTIQNKHNGIIKMLRKDNRELINKLFAEKKI